MPGKQNSQQNVPYYAVFIDYIQKFLNILPHYLNFRIIGLIAPSKQY